MTDVPVIIDLPFPCPHCGEEVREEVGRPDDAASFERLASNPMRPATEFARSSCPPCG